MRSSYSIVARSTYFIPLRICFFVRERIMKGRCKRVEVTTAQRKEISPEFIDMKLRRPKTSYLSSVSLRKALTFFASRKSREYEQHHARRPGNLAFCLRRLPRNVTREEINLLKVVLPATVSWPLHFLLIETVPLYNSLNESFPGWRAKWPDIVHEVSALVPTMYWTLMYVHVQVQFSRC